MLADVQDIIKRTGVLLDDPSNSIYTAAYLMPWIDQVYDVLDVDLENAGMQYIEAIAVVNVNANVTDLSYLLADGQPLATMKFPKRLKWKLQGQPDYLYQDSAFVSELSEVDTATSFGALEYRFAAGAIQITPSIDPLTLKIYYDQISTNVYDPNQNVVRGTGHILAIMTAVAVCGGRKGMEVRKKDLQADYLKAWNSFKSVLVKNNQSKQVTPPQMHPRRRVATPYVAAPR